MSHFFHVTKRTFLYPFFSVPGGVTLHFRYVTGRYAAEIFFLGVGNRPELPIPQSTVHTVTFDDNSRPHKGQQPACRRVVRR